MPFIKGTLGIASIQGVEAFPTPTPTSEIIKIAIQAIIGIITIWKMVRKPKENKSDDN